MDVTDIKEFSHDLQSTKTKHNKSRLGNQSSHIPPRPAPSKIDYYGGWKSFFGVRVRAYKKKKEFYRKFSFNPEVLTDQKRSWENDRKEAIKEKKEPTELFEHFVVVGLHPSTDTQAIESAFASKKEMKKNFDKYGPNMPPLQPQVLFQHPPNKRLTVKDLPGFCFPNGIKTRILERTPSMSDLNQVLYGLEHRRSDEKSFIFLLKVADNVTMYGVCLLVDEIVQRPPGISAVHSHSSFSLSNVPLSRYLVTAPRCYCLLTKLPFFDLHFQVLNNIVAQERLDRIRTHMSDTSFSSMDMSPMFSDDEDKGDDRTNDAIPVSSFLSSQDLLYIPKSMCKSNSLTKMNSCLPVSYNCYESGNDYSSVHSNSNGDASLVNDTETPKVNLKAKSDSTLSDDFLLRRSISVESFSSTLDESRSVKSLDENAFDSEEEGNSEILKFHDDHGTSAVRIWAELQENDSLLTICEYYSQRIPSRGERIIFHPPSLLRPLSFVRFCPPSHLSASNNDVFAKTKLKELEEVMELSNWTLPALCRSLSLENILSLLVCALLEKQIIVICPNLGLLSAIVLSLIPLIRPFSWQSVILPILPSEMSSFLEAPVPFIVGSPEKTEELNSKSLNNNITIVNIAKNKIKNGSSMNLPFQNQLFKKLKPIYSRLSQKKDAHCCPVYYSTHEQIEDSEKFLRITTSFLKSFCSDLKLHAITDVKPGGVRIALLLKESFVESFHTRERPFIKMFSETQLFASYSDAVLSSNEFDVEDVPM